jgi:hypothetical protein
MGHILQMTPFRGESRPGVLPPRLHAFSATGTRSVRRIEL